MNKQMNKTQIFDAIASAFNNMSNLNEMLYDYWISELYDENGNLIEEEWNETNLKIMENDIMHQSLMDNSYNN